MTFSDVLLHAQTSRLSLFFRPWSDLQVTIWAITVHEKPLSVTDNNGLMNKAIVIWNGLFWGPEASSFSDSCPERQSLFGRILNCEKRLLASSYCSSVRKEQLGSIWTDFHKKFNNWLFFRKSVEKICLFKTWQEWRVLYMKTNVHFVIVSLSILLKLRNVSDKICRENQTHVTFSDLFFFFFENRAVYEIMWKNILEPDRPQMGIWHMRIARWIFNP